MLAARRLEVNERLNTALTKLSNFMDASSKDGNVSTEQQKDYRGVIVDTGQSMEDFNADYHLRRANLLVTRRSFLVNAAFALDMVNGQPEFKTNLNENGPLDLPGNFLSMGRFDELIDSLNFVADQYSDEIYRIYSETSIPIDAEEESPSDAVKEAAVASRTVTGVEREEAMATLLVEGADLIVAYSEAEHEAMRLEVDRIVKRRIEGLAGAFYGSENDQVREAVIDVAETNFDILVSVKDVLKAAGDEPLPPPKLSPYISEDEMPQEDALSADIYTDGGLLDLNSGHVRKVDLFLEAVTLDLLHESESLMDKAAQPLGMPKDDINKLLEDDSNDAESLAKMAFSLNSNNNFLRASVPGFFEGLRKMNDLSEMSLRLEISEYPMYQGNQVETMGYTNEKLVHYREAVKDKVSEIRKIDKVSAKVNSGVDLDELTIEQVIITAATRIYQKNLALSDAKQEEGVLKFVYGDKDVWKPNGGNGGTGGPTGGGQNP